MQFLSFASFLFRINVPLDTIGILLVFVSHGCCSSTAKNPLPLLANTSRVAHTTRGASEHGLDRANILLLNNLFCVLSGVCLFALRLTEEKKNDTVPLKAVVPYFL